MDIREIARQQEIFVTKLQIVPEDCPPSELGAHFVLEVSGSGVLKRCLLRWKSDDESDHIDLTEDMLAFLTFVWDPQCRPLQASKWVLLPQDELMQAYCIADPQQQVENMDPSLLKEKMWELVYYLQMILCLRMCRPEQAAEDVEVLLRRIQTPPPLPKTPVEEGLFKGTLDQADFALIMDRELFPDK